MRIPVPALSLFLTLAACSSQSTVQVQGGGGNKSSKGRGGVAGGSGSGSGSGSNSSGSSSGSASSGSSSSGSASSGSSSSGSSGSGSSSSGSGTSTGSTVSGSSSGGSSGGSVCLQPPSDGGCWSDEPDGGPCVTLADCAAGLMCYYTGCYTGSCAPEGAVPDLSCTADGQPCGAGVPPCCGGECRSGTCAAWSRCGETADSCQTDLDCCNEFACQSGLCQPSCQQLLGPCQTTSDCCYHEGLECAKVQGFTNAVCYPGSPYQPRDSQGKPVPCGAPCSGWECQLGAACAVVGGVDPCAAAGEVCDSTYNVCRNPKTSFFPSRYYEPCQPFGEPCLPIANSTAQTVCNPLVVGGVPGNFCVQACSTTADCISPIQYCASDSDYNGSVCLDWDQCQPSQFFGPCDAEGSGDGYCYPVDYGGGPVGFCMQGTLDGGNPGDRCLFEFLFNRQVGGLCGPNEICSGGGLCATGCNAGASGAPGCDAGQVCAPWLVDPLFAGRPQEPGYCADTCDFTSPDGGGCPLDSSGIPERCFPQLVLDLVDSPSGLCAAGASAPVPLGGVCPAPIDGQLTAAGDPCAAGSICLGVSAVGALRTCVQLCNRVGQSAGCPAGQLCQPMIVQGLSVNPTHTGYCH